MSPFDLIPLLIIIGSLTVIAVVIIRKFPNLAALNVEEIPQLVQARKKEQLLKERLARIFHGKGKKIAEWMVPVLKIWARGQTAFRRTFQRTYDAYCEYKEKLEREARKHLRPRDLKAILAEADAAVKADKLDEAEKKFIEVIKADPKNLEAYRGLGKLYMEMEKYPEARETFLFLVKRKPSDGRAWNRLGMIAMTEGKFEDAREYFDKAVRADDMIAVRHFDLGRAHKALGQESEAIEAFKEAVALEPGNPRFLDALVESAIMVGDKATAQSTLVKLIEANPENQKIAEFERRITEMPS